MQIMDERSTNSHISLKTKAFAEATLRSGLSRESIFVNNQ